jgi:hypothetical protein
MNMRIIRILSLCTVFGIALPAAAWASHGKVGLWEITVQADTSHMAGMPDISKLPPQIRAQMEAMGRQTLQHCMTAAEVNSEKPDMSHSPDCKVSNLRTVGHSFSGDVVCHGRVNGTGHVEFNFPSPERYDGSEAINMVVHGQPVVTKTSFSGRWISPDCGKVLH